MDKPTLQPLTYDHDGSGMIHITRNGQHVAHMEKHNNEQAKQQEAYAQAFVAAPDLLAALKGMTEVVARMGWPEKSADLLNLADRQASARAAIAKAEGR